MASLKQKLIDISSHKNANGDLLCGVACVDMVEDRVRKRWTAVALLFSFLAPILTYSCIGNFRDAWDRSWEPPLPASIFANHTAIVETLATTMCTYESRCLQMSLASSCAVECLSLFADAGTTLAGANGTSVTTFALPEIVETPAPSDVGPWIAIFFYYIFVIIALTGNSSHVADNRWAYASLFATFVLFIGIPIAVKPESPLFLAWWPAMLGALVSFLLIVIGLWFYIKKGKETPKRLNNHIYRDWAETRKASAFEYCKRLLKRPPCPATVTLRKGVDADGIPLSYLQQADLLRQEATYYSWKYSHTRQLLALVPFLHKLRGKKQSEVPEDENITFPLRMQLAFSASLFASLLLCNTTIRLGIHLKVRSDELHLAYVQPIADGVSNVKANVESATPPFTMPTTNLISTIEWLGAHLLSVLLFLFAWLVVLLDFRSKTLRARQGRLPWKPGSVPIRCAWNLVGGATAACAVGFLTSATLIGTLWFLLAWSVSQQIIGATLTRYSGAIVGILLCYFGSHILLRIAANTLGPYHTIKWRFWWMALDFVTLFTQLFSGVATAIGRVAVALGTLTFAALRIDRSMHPHWVEEVIHLDGILLAYRATVSLYHQHNNPVMLAFLWTLQTGAKERRTATDAKRDDPTSHAAQTAEATIESGSRQLRLANKWRKAAFLTLNPMVKTKALEMIKEAILDPDAHAVEPPPPPPPDPNAPPTPIQKVMAKVPFLSPRKAKAAAIGNSSAVSATAIEAQIADADPPADAATRGQPQEPVDEQAYVDGHRARLKAKLGLSTPNKGGGGEEPSPAPSPAERVEPIVVSAPTRNSSFGVAVGSTSFPTSQNNKALLGAGREDLAAAREEAAAALAAVASIPKTPQQARDEELQKQASRRSSAPSLGGRGELGEHITGESSRSSNRRSSESNAAELNVGFDESTIAAAEKAYSAAEAAEKEAEAARAAAEKARREVDAARQDSPEPQRDELQRIDELREKKAAKDKKRAEEERANVHLKLVRPPSEHVLPTHQGLVTPGIDTPDATSDAEEEAAPADEDTLIPLGKGLRI